MNDNNTIAGLWRAGYKLWAYWKACPFYSGNPRLILGEYTIPKGWLKYIKFL